MTARDQILEMKRKGLTNAQIADKLNAQGVKPARAKKWLENNVQQAAYAARTKQTAKADVAKTETATAGKTNVQIIDASAVKLAEIVFAGLKPHQKILAALSFA